MHAQTVHVCMHAFSAVSGSWRPLWSCSLPDSSVRGISHVRIPEWVAISSSRGSSWLRDRTHVSCISCIGRWILYHCAPWEASDIQNSFFKTLVSFSNCLCWVPSTPVLQLHGDFIQFSLLSHVLLDQRLGLLKVALMVAAELAEAENTLAHLGGHWH